MAAAPSAGTSQVTPAMLKRMPASRVTGAAALRAAGAATASRPSPGGMSVCRRTDGVRIQEAAAPLARGATQTATSSTASATNVVASARVRRRCRAVNERVMWTPVSRCRCSAALQNAIGGWTRVQPGEQALFQRGRRDPSIA